MKLVIVDSGVANLASVATAVQRLGYAPEITSDAATIRTASHVVLPGVGAAGAAMTQLKVKGLIDTLRSLAQPVLGICLGMQLMFASSEEGQEDGRPLSCLGMINAQIKRMRAGPEMPVPHMGWNQIKLCVPDHPLLRDVPQDSFVYFVHSYAAPVGDYTIASTDYGAPFTAVAAERNFFGCQFHPERSSDVGSQILKNFLAM